MDTFRTIIMVMMNVKNIYNLSTLRCNNIFEKIYDTNKQKYIYLKISYNNEFVEKIIIAIKHIKKSRTFFTYTKTINMNPFYNDYCLNAIKPNNGWTMMQSSWDVTVKKKPVMAKTFQKSPLPPNQSPPDGMTEEEFNMLGGNRRRNKTRNKRRRRRNCKSRNNRK